MAKHKDQVPTFKPGTYLEESMEKRIEDADFDKTGYSYTLSLISGKYVEKKLGFKHYED